MLSIESVCKIYVAIIYKTRIVSTASAIECILCVLHLLAKVLVTSKPIIV
jgi:hypothetical protein